MKGEFVLCSDYETEIVTFSDHILGLLHRQGVVQSDRLPARTGASPCRTSGKAEKRILLTNRQQMLVAAKAKQLSRRMLELVYAGQESERSVFGVIGQQVLNPSTSSYNTRI